ncbi:MAG: BMP family ABC transporter substrate-binding protein [Eubacteriales bacterium]|nr:BMP family ABC transporter substrate-binding protein [Eubacteriales bacterium]
MKRMLALLLAFTMVLGLVSMQVAQAEDVKRIAIICDPVGVNPFLTQVVDKAKEMQEEGTYKFEYSVMECSDDAAWHENIRASVEENYDLIIGVGWQAADPLAQVATDFADRAQFICIDTVCDAANVKSYIFKPEEAAYLIGAIAASIAKDMGKPDGPFGSVNANPGEGSFPWRYGYMEGARAINPNLTLDNFVTNYTKSYTDAPVAKEFALQQAALGCPFINAASAVADYGTFEAAQEKGFYTSGQDADMTNPDNPYIVTSQIKYTGKVTEMGIKEFFEGGIVPGVVELGLKDDAVGAVYITDDGVNPRNAVLTDEIVATVREMAEKIKSGELVITVPNEADYK